ncbi:OmpA family protein [Neolewinella lacunae]|uniref:OmpA family protein n=1 Tax=Neolewinella lacunae TaxID=1517758 RepID=A0A923PLK9_9BACT|nr:OmpA family protein [Neolewinella lacunae]MBC6996413.1 OmpA family protein [Neolewinella lacunae]MDN3633644.1 OmpA family protein [Neolewinella lacunae]
MRLYPYLLTLTLSIYAAAALSAQGDGTLFLRNPSFEDMPRNSAAPLGWTNCGFPVETPPDIHPDPKFEFSVSKRPFDQKTYLGMVTRENETYESVGQQLGAPMVGGQCYEFRIHLARSEVYLSRSRLTGAPSNYNTPIRLKIYGGYSICDRAQELGRSAVVSNYDWQEYRIKLSPDEDYTHITLEAFYNTPMLVPYNGNLLLDNIQPIRPIDCEKDLNLPDGPAEAPVVVLTNPENRIRTTPVTPRGSQNPPNGSNSSPPAPKVKLGLTEAALREGQVFAIEEITFKANSAELEAESEEALQEIVGFMQQNKNVVVEIGGHASRLASPSFANSLSENRARSVVSYLKTYNIGFERMLPKGYGNSRPVCMDNAPDCNRRNQRVEVKILKLRESR